MDELFKEALKLHDDTVSLIELSSRWLNDSTLWENDDYLSPMWQEIYNRRYELEQRWMKNQKP